MTNLYYQIWADAIVYERTKHGDFQQWKTITMLAMSAIQGINLLSFFFLMISLGFDIYPILEFDFLPSNMANALSGFIILFLPFIIINYIFVFRNKRYEEIVKRNKYRNGKLFFAYFVVSFLLFILPLVIGMIFFT